VPGLEPVGDVAVGLRANLHFNLQKIRVRA
jgi:hypothetical protein